MDDLLKKLKEVHGLSEEKAKGILKTVSEHIQANVPALKDKISGLFSSDTVNSIKDKASHLSDNLSSGAKETSDKISEEAKEIGDKLADETKNIGSKISEGAKGLFNKFVPGQDKE